ncbi:5-oxoprolinase subunit B family protein [Rhodobacter sp. NSM]|uniref:5-oxoprolinase subunit B family protein n=1 Tax=Rhodobacter sp. NSM TaxID=3457501 RepID=UPI003FCEEC98
MSAFPRLRPVAERAVLVEFAEEPSPEAEAGVAALDAAVAASPFAGFDEAVPAYVSLLVTFDPLCTDHEAVAAALRSLIAGTPQDRREGRLHELPVCYDEPFARDLAEVADRTGLAPEAVIAAHSGADYRVVMYGFAPGYAYLTGVPGTLHLPRKPAALRDIPSGSLLIAGPQCLVSTLTMPTGWWILGRSPARILTGEAGRPFLFDPGDRVRFRRIPAGDMPE